MTRLFRVPRPFRLEPRWWHSMALSTATCLALMLVGLSLWWPPGGVAADQAPVSAPKTSNPLDAARAYRYLVDICRIGPRMSGSQGMAQQQKLIVEHFAKFGAQVRYQSFDSPHPVDGTPVRMNNIIVSWHPAAKDRVLLACHYDTRPFADRELNPLRRNDPFIGANDGGSGVALFMELAHHMKGLQPTYGVDFVFFDAEEFIFGLRGEYFIGSEYFAKDYRDNPPAHRYVCGVLVDMVADKQLNLYMEVNSVRYAPQVTQSVWDAAARLGISEFVPRRRHEVRDDHIPLNEIARIPTCDIIDFDYPYWHTTRDVPANCSGESLAKVGYVLLEWLQNVPAVQ